MPKGQADTGKSHIPHRDRRVPGLQCPNGSNVLRQNARQNKVKDGGFIEHYTARQSANRHMSQVSQHKHGAGENRSARDDIRSSGPDSGRSYIIGVNRHAPVTMTNSAPSAINWRIWVEIRWGSSGTMTRPSTLALKGAVFCRIMLQNHPGSGLNKPRCPLLQPPPRAVERALP